jgi:hypothetical protein
MPSHGEACHPHLLTIILIALTCSAQGVCVRTGFRTKRWNEDAEICAPEGV